MTSFEAAYVSLSALLVLIAAALLLWAFTSRTRLMRRNRSRIDASMRELEAAHEEAEDIVTEASNEAEAILHKAHQYTGQAKQSLQRTLSGINEDVAASARETSKEQLELLEEAQQQQMADLKSELASFRKEELARARKEIAAFIDDEKRRAADDVVRRAEKILEEVIGKAISVDDHRELIMKGLERARADGVFEETG